MWLPQRVCCLAVGWFRHGLLLRRGPAQPASGKECSRAVSTSFREGMLACRLDRVQGEAVSTSRGLTARPGHIRKDTPRAAHRFFGFSPRLRPRKVSVSRASGPRSRGCRPGLVRSTTPSAGKVTRQRRWLPATSWVYRCAAGHGRRSGPRTRPSRRW